MSLKNCSGCWLLVIGVMLSAAPALAQNYVGAERCGQCHEFAYKMWLTSSHAKAHQALTPEQLGDAKCNNCHTVVQDGADASNVATTAKLAGVQCEACHGAGKVYQASYVMKDKDLAHAVGLIDPTAATCQQCHTEGAPSIAPFDFKTLWARIDHSKAAREKWERTRGRTAAKAP